MLKTFLVVASALSAADGFGLAGSRVSSVRARAVSPSVRVSMASAVVPHGGKLVNLMVDSGKAAELKKSCTKKVELSDRQSCDVELLCVGGLSPLTGFMSKADYESVHKTNRMTDGLLFGLPIVMDTSDESIKVRSRHVGTPSPPLAQPCVRADARVETRLLTRARAHSAACMVARAPSRGAAAHRQTLARTAVRARARLTAPRPPFALYPLLSRAPVAQAGDKLLLTYKGQEMAMMTVTEKYFPDKARECVNSYGTASLEHPGVRMVAMERGKYYLSGPIVGFEQPKRDFPCKTPEAVRANLPSGKDVVAFQCRNPIHRAHYELFMRALTAENVDPSGTVLVHPTCGPTQEGDIDGTTRYKVRGAAARRVLRPAVASRGRADGQRAVAALGAEVMGRGDSGGSCWRLALPLSSQHIKPAERVG
jgi:uncharacterized protein (DUF2147 family)